jgi:putative tricarboxylic transport membrane protein
MISRRTFAAGIAGASALSLSPSMMRRSFAAWAPSNDVELVIPYAPGGGADILGRVVGKIIAEQKFCPVNVIPVNKPGGGSAVGIGYVASNRAASPETLVVLNNATVLTPLKVANAPGWRELRPLANFIGEDYLLFVKGDAPWNSLKDVIDDAKAKYNGAITLSSGGSSDELAARIIARAGGIKFTFGNFSGGGEALNALLGGHVQATIGNPIEFLGQVKAGAIKALATLGEARYSLLPDVPTTKESGLATVRFEAFRGIAGPKGMPDEAAAYWIGVLEKVAASAQMKAYVEQNAAREFVLSGDAYTKYLTEQEKVFREYLA